ncbi:MAG: long-chain fatty acid--CoA ligase [bacterium]
MYIGDYLARRTVYTPHSLALIDYSEAPARRYTFEQLNQRANKLANWLQAAGIKKRQRVAMLAYDGVHFYDAFFACCKIGAIFLPLNWRLHAREIEHQIGHTQPHVLFYASQEPMGQIVQHLKSCPEMPQLIPLDGDDKVTFQRAIQVSSATPVSCESITEMDSACLLFTGGTTGRPKAAQMSHRQIVWNTLNSLLGDVLGSDTYLNIFPLFHAGGLFAFSLPILIQGGTVIQTKKFDADEVLKIIETERATIFGGVPAIFQMLTQASGWPAADLSSLRYCMSGGAPMPLPLIRKYQKEKGVVFRQGFGMTEFGPGVFSLAAQDAQRKAGSIGKPNFFVDARVVDPETNQPKASGEIGELVLRGPSATTGYFRDKPATRAAFDEDNYFHTGDLAYVDEEGYFYIVDRLKDMYISGGENVYPAEVEDVLYRHPAVAMCAVIGVEDTRWGQSGCAFVVLKKNQTATAENLRSFLRQHLAKYKIPQKFIFKERLPLSGAGKIHKAELRKTIKST